MNKISIITFDNYYDDIFILDKYYNNEFEGNFIESNYQKLLNLLKEKKNNNNRI